MCIRYRRDTQGAAGFCTTEAVCAAAWELQGRGEQRDRLLEASRLVRVQARGDRLFAEPWPAVQRTSEEAPTSDCPWTAERWGSSGILAAASTHCEEEASVEGGEARSGSAPSTSWLNARRAAPCAAGAASTSFSSSSSHSVTSCAFL